MPWYSDLDLERYGVRYVTPELNVALVTEDDQVLEWWTDFDRTIESFATICPRDAATLGDWVRRFRPVVQNILTPEAQSPPLSPEQRRALLCKSAEGKLLLEVSQLSPIEFVRKEFTHPIIQAGLLFFNGLREVDLRCRGFGHHIPALLASGRMAQMCEHGSKRLADGLVKAIQDHGGEIDLNVKLRRIIVESGRSIQQWADWFSPAVFRRWTIPNTTQSALSMRLLLPSRRKHHRTSWIQLRPGDSSRPRNSSVLDVAAPCRAWQIVKMRS